MSFNGYWEFPCKVCARASEVASPELGPCWPDPDFDTEEAAHTEAMDRAKRVANIIRRGLSDKELAEVVQALDEDANNEILRLLSAENQVRNPHLYAEEDEGMLPS